MARIFECAVETHDISAGLVTQLEIIACYEGLTEVILVDVLS